MELLPIKYGAKIPSADLGVINKGERAMPDEKGNFKDLVLQKEKEGKVVFMTVEGPMSANLEEFIKQPTEGLLYDLNRDRVTVLTFIDDVKWVNDFAVGLVITKLKEIIDNKGIESDGKKDAAAHAWRR